MKSVKGARLSVWLDRMLFLSDTQASEKKSKLEVAAAGWKAAEVGETQPPEASGRVDCEGSPSIRNSASGEGLPH